MTIRNVASHQEKKPKKKPTQTDAAHEPCRKIVASIRHSDSDDFDEICVAHPPPLSPIPPNPLILPNLPTSHFPRVPKHRLRYFLFFSCLFSSSEQNRNEHPVHRPLCNRWTMDNQEDWLSDNDTDSFRPPDIEVDVPAPEGTRSPGAASVYMTLHRYILAVPFFLSSSFLA